MIGHSTPMADMYSLICVEPGRAKLLWPHISGTLAMAFEYATDDETINDVYVRIMDGRDLLWVIWNGTRFALSGCVVTRLIEMKRTKVCQIIACSGQDIDNWLDLIAGIETYAKNEGCDRVRLRGRQGWKRMLDRHGYREPWITMEKRL